jgi:uncharacterized protein (TIRG00374 family)
MDDKAARFQRQKKLLLQSVRIAGSGLLLFFSFYSIDWGKFRVALAQSAPAYLLFAPLVSLLNNTLSALRWQIILKQWKIQPGFWNVWKIYLISSFWGNFLPSTIGGDGYRFLALRSYADTSKTKILSSLFLDRLYGLVAIITVHAIVLIFYWEELRQTPLLFNIEIGGMAAIFLALVFGIAFRFFFQKIRMPLFASKFFDRAWDKITEIYKLIRQQGRRSTLLGMMYSLLFVGVIAAAWQMYYLVVGIRVSWGVAIYAATLIGILGMLPITLNGIGIMEFALVAILNWQNIPAEKAILVALLTRVMQILLSLPGGLLYMFDSHTPNLKEDTHE